MDRNRTIARRKFASRSLFGHKGRVSWKSWVWLLPLALLVVAVVLVPVRMFEPEGLPRYRALTGELATVKNENARIQREVEELTREVESLRADPHAVERVARDELGMVRLDEVVFQF